MCDPATVLSHNLANALQFSNRLGTLRISCKKTKAPAIASSFYHQAPQRLHRRVSLIPLFGSLKKHSKVDDRDCILPSLFGHPALRRVIMEFVDFSNVISPSRVGSMCFRINTVNTVKDNETMRQRQAAIEGRRTKAAVS